VKIAVVCDPNELKAGRELSAALEGQGLDATLVEPDPPAGSGLTAALAHYLVALEDHLGANPADAVALIGSGDCPFAGVLVATKARVPAFRLAGGVTDAEPDNGALIDRLADQVVDRDPAAAAESIQRALPAS
jgi:hypothetical protein